MNSCVVSIDLGVTSEHVACISDGDGKPSKKTIRFSRRHCKSDNLDATTLVRASLIDAQSLQEIQLTDATTFALKRASGQQDKFTRECSRIKQRILSFCVWVMPGVKECFSVGPPLICIDKNFTL